MANDDWQTAVDLTQRLETEPFAFDFFRAVRLLEAARPDSSRLGDSLSPNEDAVRFGQTPSLAFAPSTLAGFQPRDEGHAPKLLANFFGLFGPNGPMPAHVTEYAHERQFNLHDRTLAAFFDVFHHRFFSLFYRAWAANQKTVDLDRPVESRYAVYVGSLFGIGIEELRNRDAVPDWAKLFFSGRLVPHARNAEGLGAILQEFFGIPTTIETFIGQWLELPPSSACRLGESPETGCLGMSAVIGSRFFDCQLKFRARLGPMCLADVYRLLPTGDSFQRLKCWVKNYVGDEFFWDVQLVLKADEVPDIQLGQSGMLGWTTWLKSKPFTRDAEDLILNPENN